ncbi:MAG: hypothetical protein COU81_02940 [Candidatus Portnoybacteria bacterium CG10_big_fil_rev_8_21_14_0_10_36_7]|uniref:DUF2029 domain-containing protein n=1 Tax=Candidatus Portnoybacteria bacterium CG10_big_fil_rev_8_21_14_0_10_36_7 TaxID=1974812 RepID=A0A2M8KDN1_9BACT|nr:MAG: hypothetical protein COU81_02940 [Candidatus Portnoybacteria bacterium CG10_big_fil_rev_8_21_14_0_10_36_7]
MWFSISGVYLLIASVSILSIAIFLKNPLKISNDRKEDLLKLTLILFVLINFSINVVDINGELSFAMVVNRLSLFLSILGSLLFFLYSGGQNKIFNFLFNKKFLILIILAFVIELTSIRILKTPDIDVLGVLKNGPLRVLALQNPYETSATNNKLSDVNFGYYHYAYGPTTIYLFLPFDFIFKDPRYLLIIASMVTAYTLYMIAKLSGQGELVSQLLPLIYLFNPRTFYFLSYVLTDGLIISLMGLALLFLAKNRFKLFSVAVAFALGIKIFYAIPFFFFLKLKALRKPGVILWGFLTLFLIHMPFVLLNFRALYKSIVSINTNPEVFSLLRRAGLTFATLMDRQFHYYPPEKFFVISILLIILIAWIFIPKAKNLANAICGVSVVFVLSVFFGPIGNGNYYSTASGLLLFALASFNLNND